MDNSGFVNIPVPIRFYEEVQRTITRLINGEGSEPLERGWTAAEIRRQKQLPLNATARAVMDLTTDYPGSRVSFADVCKRAGRNPAQARAELASWTKLIRREFKDASKDWPVMAYDNQGGYQASPALARVWKAASDNDGLK